MAIDLFSAALHVLRTPDGFGIDVALGALDLGGNADTHCRDRCCRELGLPRIS